MSLLLGASLILNLMVLVTSCGTGVVGHPRWNGRWWAGDAQNQRVIDQFPDGTIRGTIRTADPQFSEGYWVSKQDLACLYEQVILNCSEWHTLEPKCSQVGGMSMPVSAMGLQGETDAEYHGTSSASGRGE